MKMSSALDGAESAYDPAMICRNFVYAYPPGVPVMVPGELFTEEIFGLMDELDEGGITMRYM